MFENNFDFGVNFSGENFCWRFFSLELFFADREKNHKNRKNSNPQKFSATRYTVVNIR